MKKKSVAAFFAGALVLALSMNAFADDDKTITVAASPTPHAEILEKAKEILAKDGWDLEVVEYEALYAMRRVEQRHG